MSKKVKAAPEVAPEVQEAQEKAMIDALVAKVNAAQKEFANFPQEKVDRISTLEVSQMQKSCVSARRSCLSSGK